MNATEEQDTTTTVHGRNTSTKVSNATSVQAVVAICSLVRQSPFYAAARSSNDRLYPRVVAAEVASGSAVALDCLSPP